MVGNVSAILSVAFAAYLFWHGEQALAVLVASVAATLWLVKNVERELRQRQDEAINRIWAEIEKLKNRE